MHNYKKLSIFLSLILRHKPETISLELDKNGWADVSELIEKMNLNGRKIDKNILEHIVDTDEKNRYSFNDDKTKIRANQGHSIDVDVELETAVPPEILYHGTASHFCINIMKTGIQRRSRNYVHLSLDAESAAKVGARHGKSVVLEILAAQMHNDKYVFYLSKNNVWLTETVPPEYIKFDEGVKGE